MAKKCMIRRENKRIRKSSAAQKRRKALKKQILDTNIGFEERLELVNKLDKLPKDSSEVRVTRRCALTGRPKGVIRRFGLCRNMVRKLAMEGLIPGLVKSSW